MPRTRSGRSWRAPVLGAVLVLLVAGSARAAVQCAGDADCNDQNACTADQCVEGACVNAELPDCASCAAPDACALPSCAIAPQCTPLERCGDCKDNDGDGLTDYEDPDCCLQQTRLTVRTLRLKPTTTAAGSRMRLMAHADMYADPMDDVTMQIADRDGQLFCRTIPAESWREGSSTVFRFRDRTGRKATGLRLARLQLKKNGRLVLRTRGKEMPLRFTAGGPTSVTVRLGFQCASTGGMLSPRRNILLFAPPVR
jgi:hypothetical protein